jgi:hypothetical protein
MPVVRRSGIRRVGERFAAAVVLAAAAQLFPATAGGQRVAGTVRDGGTAQPLAGALVSTLDAAGAVLASALSDQQGRFSLQRTSSGMTLRVKRIGYLPATRSLAGVAAVDSLAIALDRIPTLLGAVRVSTQASCAGSGSTAALSLWEQARAGLEAMVVARDNYVARAVSMTYSRIINDADSEIVEQTTRLHQGTATRPFRARADPAVFARVGYVQPEPTGERLFSAPDADVLLAPTFAASHCFAIVSQERRGAARLGLAFRPSDRRSPIVDIAGTLWFTPDPLALDELDFSYADSVNATDSLHAGGRIVFRTVPNGVSLVRDWTIRVPAAGVLVAADDRNIEGATVRRLGGNGDAPSRRLRVTQWRETGGRVLAAAWPDGSRAADTLGNIVGFVEQRETGEPAAHVLVVLRATGDTVSTDSVGIFRFDRLLPGRYAIAALDTTYAAYTREEATVVSVIVHDGMQSSTIARVASPDSALHRLCPALADATPRSIILGRILSPRLNPQWEVGAAWQDDYSSVRGNVGILAAARTMHPDADGRYFVCGVVRERPIHLSVWLGKDRLLDTTTVVGPTVVKRVDLVMPRGPDRS